MTSVGDAALSVALHHPVTPLPIPVVSRRVEHSSRLVHSFLGNAISWSRLIILGFLALEDSAPPLSLADLRFHADADAPQLSENP